MASSRPPLWRDVRVVRFVLQAVFLLLVGALLWSLATNMLGNMRAAGLSTTFDFLDQPARVDIRDSDFRPAQPVRDALLVGFTNTIRVAALGIALASVLGIFVGVMRLSPNWLVRRVAALYVEAFRNVPVLLVIIFFYTAIFLRLPAITEAAEYLGAFVFSNRGMVVPYGEATGDVRAFLIVLGVALAAAVAVAVWRTRRSDAGGAPHHRVLWGLGTLLLIAGVGYALLGGPVALSLPTRDGRVVTGGISLGPEYAALLLALVIYTASHIAEIVRGSILAVPKGQSEAANSLGLSGFQRMRHVVLPQAFRIMIPPLSNQYLNLTKNSSLAVAIGYFELTRLSGQTIANGNPAPQVIAVLAFAYLVLSLLIAGVSNFVNRRLSLEAR